MSVRNVCVCVCLRLRRMLHSNFKPRAIIRAHALPPLLSNRHSYYTIAGMLGVHIRVLLRLGSTLIDFRIVWPTDYNL
jgi:hypothetical protein